MRKQRRQALRSFTTLLVMGISVLCLVPTVVMQVLGLAPVQMMYLALASPGTLSVLSLQVVVLAERFLSEGTGRHLVVVLLVVLMLMLGLLLLVLVLMLILLLLLLLALGAVLWLPMLMLSLM